MCVLCFLSHSKTTMGFLNKIIHVVTVLKKYCDDFGQFAIFTL